MRYSPAPPRKFPDQAGPGGVVVASGVAGFLALGGRVLILDALFAVLIIGGFVLMFGSYLHIRILAPTRRNVVYYRLSAVVAVVFVFGIIIWAHVVSAQPLFHITGTQDGYIYSPDHTRVQPHMNVTIVNDSDDDAYVSHFGKVAIASTPPPKFYNDQDVMQTATVTSKMIRDSFKDVMPKTPPGEHINGRQSEWWTDWGPWVPSKQKALMTSGRLLWVSSGIVRIMRHGQYSYLPYCLFWSGSSWVSCDM